MYAPRSVLIALAVCAVVPIAPRGQPVHVDQNAEPPNPAFEVVSIREVDSTSVQIAPGTWAGPRQTPCKYLPGRVQCQLTLDSLISEAYQLKRNELAGPDWLNKSTFALQATMPPDTPTETARVMLQQVLEERFGLKAHREKREIAVYALLVGKNGANLQEAGDVQHRQRQVHDTPMGKIKAAKFFTLGQYFSMAITLDDFAVDLSNYGDLELPVVNMTGLTGGYRVDLKWPPDIEEVHNGHDPGFTRAAQQQLGLRFEKQKLAYNVLVVDHVENRPTEN